MQQAVLVGIATALTVIAGPVLLGLAGWVHARRTPAVVPCNSPTRWDWKLSSASALLYTLAFNLTFFIQELFLVLPKALVPGLRPTLFHNNHGWEGENPLASLFQGTGASATFVGGMACMWWLRCGAGRSPMLRLFLVWMAYCGCLMALPQVAVGALSAGSDVGMAMEYLQLGVATKTIVAVVALALIPPVALWLGRRLLGLADDPARIANARARSRFIFQLATSPALVAIALILPFRVPRDWIEVVMVPAVVTVIGIAWIQAGAWRMEGVQAAGSRNASIAWPLLAVVLLLLVFQVVLRPGIHFY